MQQFILKVIILSLVLLGNAVSFGMLTTIDMRRLPKDIRKHIFVVACPSIKNQLKMCCKSWHAIGAKKAPNMYKLINNESFNPSHDDWCYIMMHAALDENVGVMKNILNSTRQRSFGYDLGNSKSIFGTKKIFRLSFDLYDTSDCNGLPNNNWKEKAYEKCTGLDLKLNPLFMACFSGDVNTIKDIAEQWRKVYRIDGVDANIVHDCFYIAMYNDNPHCIEELAPLVRRMGVGEISLDLLVVAMYRQKKRAFKALVKNNVYDCLNDSRVSGEICKQTDIYNLAEYIAIYRKHHDKNKRNTHSDYRSSGAGHCSVQ
jgi:hypothetical protein